MGDATNIAGVESAALCAGFKQLTYAVAGRVVDVGKERATVHRTRMTGTVGEVWGACNIRG